MNYLALTIPGTGKITAPSGVPTGGLNRAEGIIQNGIVIMLVGAALFSLAFMLWAGIDWIMSGGDKTKLQAAKNKLTYAIIGLIVCFLSFFIIAIIATFFDVPLLPGYNRVSTAPKTTTTPTSTPMICPPEEIQQQRGIDC